MDQDGEVIDILGAGGSTTLVRRDRLRPDQTRPKTIRGVLPATGALDLSSVALLLAPRLLKDLLF